MMEVLRYRKLTVGDDNSVLQLPVWSSAEGVEWFDGFGSFLLTASKELDAITVDDFPEWLRRQNPPMTLTEVRRVTGPTRADAVSRMFEALHGEVKYPGLLS